MRMYQSVFIALIHPLFNASREAAKKHVSCIKKKNLWCLEPVLHSDICNGNVTTKVTAWYNRQLRLAHLGW